MGIPLGGGLHISAKDFFYSFHIRYKTYSPERDFDGHISINCNSEKTEDGALSQYQDKTCQKEASIEVQTYAEADGYGEGDGEATDQNISHSQRHQKVVGGVLQSGVDRDCPAHQYVAGY